MGRDVAVRLAVVVPDLGVRGHAQRVHYARTFAAERRKRDVQLSTAALAAIAAEVRSQTASFLQTGTKDRLAQIRAALDPDDQTLLILRIDRKLPWREIAQVFEAEADAVEQRAAALRKRFERLKADLRDQLRSS